MALNVKPLGDRVLVEAVEEKEVTKGGIIISDTAKEKPMESVVVALGTGKTDENGKKVPFEVKKGDHVLVSKYGGTEIKLDGKEYKILSSDDILEFSQEPSVIGEMTNQITVEWFDPVAKQTRTTQPVKSLGRIMAAGGVIPETKKYPEIPVESLALRTAEQPDEDVPSRPKRLEAETADLTPGG